jgi:hypothetical protein
MSIYALHIKAGRPLTVAASPLGRLKRSPIATPDPNQRGANLEEFSNREQDQANFPWQIR